MNMGMTKKNLKFAFFYDEFTVVYLVNCIKIKNSETLGIKVRFSIEKFDFFGGASVKSSLDFNFMAR